MQRNGNFAVSAGVAAKILPELCNIYLKKGVELRGDDAVASWLRR